MENVSSALKMASAMILFTLALSAFFVLVAKIKNLSDSVLSYSDYTNFYQWMEGGSVDGERIVDENTVIAALYSQEVSPVHVYIKSNGSFIYEDNMEINLQDFIKTSLSEGNTYKESIIDIRASGEYRVASDGTRVALRRRKY